jgi:hypothetical protein
MPTLRQVNRIFVRAALIWALICGLLFLTRASSEFVSLPLGTRAGEAAIAALVLGFFGNLWLSAMYSLSASLPGSKPVPLKSAPYLLPLWQIGSAASSASAFEAYRNLPGSQLPKLSLTVVAAYTSFVTIRSIRSRVADPSAAHWTNLVACIELFFGSLLATLAGLGVVTGFIADIGVALVALGWSYHAALVLFVRAFDLEPYDDQAPVYVAFGAALVMVIVIFLGPRAAILMTLAQLVFILALAYLLQRRWFGKFLSWEERFLMAGVVAGFLGVAGAATSTEGYLLALGLQASFGAAFPILATGVVILPLSFGAAYVAKERSRSLRSGMCQTIVAAVVAAALPQFLMSLVYLDPYYRYGIFAVRILFGIAEIVVAAGLVALASLAKGLGRPRADLRPV